MVVFLALVGTGLLLGIELDSWNFQYYLSNLLVNTLGHVSYLGLFPSNAVSIAEKVPGVSRAEAFYLVIGDYNGTTVVLVDDRILETSPLFNYSSLPQGYEALIYTSLGSKTPPAFPVKPGENITLKVYDVRSHGWTSVSLKIVGRASSPLTITNSMTPVLVVDHNVLRKFTMNHPTWIAVWVSNPSQEKIMKIASEVRVALVRNGSWILDEYVSSNNTGAVLFIKSMTRFFIPYLLSALLIVAVFNAASVMASIGRDTRRIAVLKALGASTRELYTTYILPWAIRTLIGVLLGILAAPYIGVGILQIAVHNSEFLQAFFHAYGFHKPPKVLLEYGALAYALALSGAALSGILIARINVREGLTFYGLKVRRAMRIGIGSIKTRIAVRDAFQKPWKTIGFILALAVLLGSVMGATGVTHSLQNYMNWYWSNMDYDVYFELIPPYEHASSINHEGIYVILSNKTIVEDYECFTWTSGFFVPGLQQRVFVYTLLRGDLISLKTFEGRPPERPGEVAVSLTLSEIMHKSIGDVITVNTTRGGETRLKITGIMLDKANSLNLWVTPSDFKEVTGLNINASIMGCAIKLSPEYASNPEKASGILAREFQRASPGIRVYYSLESDMKESWQHGIRTISGVAYGLLLASLIAGVGVVISLSIADIAGSRKEVGVIRSIGFTSVQIGGLYALQIILSIIVGIPLSYALGYLITAKSLQAAIDALGYVPPSYGIGVIVDPYLLVTAVIAVVLTLVAAWRYVARVNIVEELRETG